MRHWMVEDVLVNRNVRFSVEIVDEVCRELSASDGRWSDVRQNRKPMECGWAYGSRNDSHCFIQLPVMLVNYIEKLTVSHIRRLCERLNNFYNVQRGEPRCAGAWE